MVILIWLYIIVNLGSFTESLGFVNEVEIDSNGSHEGVACDSRAAKIKEGDTGGMETVRDTGGAAPKIMEAKAAEDTPAMEAVKVTQQETAAKEKGRETTKRLMIHPQREETVACR